MKYLKNILILIIGISILAPSLSPVFAASPKGLIGGFVTEAAQASKDAALSTLIGGFVSGIHAANASCQGISAVLGTGAIIDPFAAFGQCLQRSLAADIEVAREGRAIAKEKLTWIQKLLDFADEIAYTLFKKVIMDRLVDALIQWINNDGKGGVIEDWGQFFDDAANIAAGEFVQQLGAGFLCSGFNFQAQLTLLPVTKFSNVTCTLNDIVGNINNFFEDFRNGSWAAYQETWYPRNNFYGSVIVGLDNYHRDIAKSQDTAKSKAASSFGFKPVEKCGFFLDTMGSYDKNGGVLPPNYSGPRYARQCRIVTPGVTLAEGATAALISIPYNRLIHSEDLSAYIAAIIDASINKLVIAGKDGIVGLLSKAAQNVKINPVFPCAGLTGDTFKACMNSVNAERRDFASAQDGLMQSTTNSSIEARTTYSDILTQSIAIQEEYVTDLDALAVCKGNPTDLTTELVDEQILLDDLKDKFDTNLTYIDSANNQNEQISGINPATGVTVDDFSSLSNLAQNSSTFILDSFDASNEIINAQTELDQIKAKVAEKSPNIKAQLFSCPAPAPVQ